MNVLVTGGAGFIGSRLAMRLVADGHDVTVADNLTSTHSLKLLEAAQSAVRFVHMDVRCQEDFDRLPAGPYDRVYHLAASFANALSVEHPTLDARTNVLGTLHTIKFAQRAGCGVFVYTGSSSSYGDAPCPLREDAPMQPATPYAMSKLAAERHVRESGLPHAVFRLFNVFGPGDPPGVYRNAIPNMFKSLDVQGGRIRVFGEGATRDFTYVDDAVDILAAPGPAQGAVVNVGTGEETQVIDVVHAILRLFDLPTDRLEVAERRSWDQVVRRIADVSRLRERYGRVPACRLRERLPQTARWLVEHGYLRDETLVRRFERVSASHAESVRQAG